VSGGSVALAPDPAVPQRDRLLNLDAMAGHLSRSLGRDGAVPLRWCRLECISYRPGRRLRAVYRVGIDGEDVLVAASTFSEGRVEAAYEHAMAGAVARAGPLGPVGYAAELDSVFWTFPNDRRLGHLSAVAEARADLSRLVDNRWTRSRLVKYNPETSAVVACLDDSSRVIAYAKVHEGDEGERAHRLHRAFARVAANSGPRIARPIAYSHRYRTQLVEPVIGTSVHELAGAGLLAGLHAYGVALARLHSLPPDGVRADGRDALERLQRKAEAFRIVRPDVTEQLSAVLGELSARLGVAREPQVPIHGDANESNAILQVDQVALIDFERAGVGAASSDIGNVLGLIRYFRSVGLISALDERSRTVAFRRGYSSVRGLPHRDALRAHESAALVERAFRAVARLRAAALPHIPALLAEARSLLR
jgi:aminoglycoside phosphotransferase (APT) family kinase protein